MNSTRNFASPIYSSGEIESNVSNYSDARPIKDGIWYWKVRTRDVEGDWGPFCGCRQLKIDATPPAGFIPQATPAGWTNGPVEIAFWTSDKTSGIDRYELSVDGNALSKEMSPYVLPELPDGAYIVVIRAYDKACNHVDERVNVFIDRTGPEPFTPTASPACWTSGPPRISFSTEDNLSGIDHYEVSVDREVFSLHTSPYLLPELTDGEHVVTARAFDKAGNFQDGNVTVYIDKTMPDSLVLSVDPTGWTKEDPVVSFCATDRMSYIDRYEVKVDNGDFAVRTSPFTVPNLTDGSHNITVRA
jgi:hypothetical protein